MEAGWLGEMEFTTGNATWSQPTPPTSSPRVASAIGLMVAVESAEMEYSVNRGALDAERRAVSIPPSIEPCNVDGEAMAAIASLSAEEAAGESVSALMAGEGSMLVGSERGIAIQVWPAQDRYHP